MPKWLYAAWTLAVLLAIVLPIAVPYAIWRPPDTGPGSWGSVADAEMFGRWARTQIEGTRFVPTSVEVEAGPLLSAPVRCDGPLGMHELPRVYTAKVTVRGAYGIPLTTYEVRCNGWDRTGRTEGGMLVLGLGALLIGMVAVSMPFTFFWLRAMLNRRLQPVL
jgi:hypothetical protein